jgi:hypothetical protein
MKKLLLSIALIAVLLSVTLVTGCVRVNMAEKNGPLTTRNYEYTGFTGVDVGSALKLEVAYGTAYNVTITAGEKLLDKIAVSQTGDTLKVTIDGWSINWWWGNNTPKIKITMPVLSYLHLSGASDGTVTGFESGNAFDVKVSGASDLDIDMETGAFSCDISGASNVRGRLTAASTNIIMSGASDINLTGTGGDTKIKASGASSVSLPYFVARDADINFSGASDGILDVRGRLDVTLSGSSDLKYSGNPTLGHVDTSDASDLNKVK